MTAPAKAHDPYENPHALARVQGVTAPQNFALRKVIEGHGDVLGAAMEAMLAAIVNFTLPASRDTMRALLKKSGELAEKAKAKVIARVNSPEMEKAIMAEFDKEMSRAATSTAGN